MTVVIDLCTSADADNGVSSPEKPENNNSFNDSALQPVEDDEVCQDAFHLPTAELELEEEEEDEVSEADSNESRSDEELEGIAWEMQQLEKKFTGLKDTYKLVDRLGEGTFSSVYKALDLRHHQFDNLKWCQHQECITCDIDRHHKHSTVDPPFPTPDPTSSETSEVSKGKKRKRFTEEEEVAAENLQVTLHASKRLSKKAAYVAIKRIYVTSSPIRIQNELEILALLRDADNVAHLITAFRHEDQILAVMPYEKHYDFRDFYRSLPLSQIRNYLRCLFNGLQFAHKKGIIHRDIKPANFLFDPTTGEGKVCDFGLAETFDPSSWHSKCLHSVPAHGLGLPHGRLLNHPVSLWQQVKDYHKMWNKMSSEEKEKHGNQRPWLPWSEEDEDELEDKEREMQDFMEDWQPVDLQEKKAKGKVGYFKPELDRRPSVRANRAGTRGFRAPEVLLKCPDQTISLDIWSVGGILLSFLTCRFPFFASSDDVEALMEIATIFGKKKMDVVAALHNRTFITNVPAVTDPEHTSLHQLVLSLNKKIFDTHTPADWASSSDDERDEYGWYDSSQPLYQAIDLLRKCLALDCTKRISAAKALEHEFFKMEIP